MRTQAPFQLAADGRQIVPEDGDLLDPAPAEAARAPGPAAAYVAAPPLDRAGSRRR